MASLDSLVRMINSRISDFYKSFGSNSIEYHKVKSLVFQALGDFDILLKERKGKPIGISRAKKVREALISFEEDIHDLWEDIKKLGTPKSIKAKNYAGLSNEEVREKSEYEYKSKFNDQDLYEEIQDEIVNQSKIPRADRDWEYWNALIDCMDIFCSEGRNDIRYTRILNIYTEAKLNHEEWLKEHIEDGSIVDYDDYDMGENL